MLEHTQHAELALLIDQSVVGDDGKIEMQGSGDPDGGDDIVLFDLIHHIHSLGHLAKDGVHPIEMRLGGVSDEELAATGVLPGVGHGQGAGCMLVGIQVSLTLDLVPGSAGADPRIVRLLRKRISPLDHEVGDNSVELGSIIELAVGQLLEVADSPRYFGVEQFRLYRALAGFNCCALSHGCPLGEV